MDAPLSERLKALSKAIAIRLGPYHISLTDEQVEAIVMNDTDVPPLPTQYPASAIQRLAREAMEKRFQVMANNTVSLPWPDLPYSIADRDRNIF